jgi:hypothetical protein
MGIAAKPNQKGLKNSIQLAAVPWQPQCYFIMSATAARASGPQGLIGY